jgi:hypothetical protein
MRKAGFEYARYVRELERDRYSLNRPEWTARNGSPNMRTER